LQLIDKDAKYKNNVNKDILASVKHTAKTRKACLCANPNSTLAKITKKITANKKLNDLARVRLINKFYQEY
jgi:phosphopantothenoylcysteine synthetase/decarboxylase